MSLLKPSLWAGLLAAAPIALAVVNPPITEIPVRTIEGKPTTLKEQPGRLYLVVNVASKCGLTPQYTALEKLHRTYQPRGLAVVGFPCNDFGAQEPGTPQEIVEFCKTRYDVSFPLMEKVHVKGPEQHPLYAALTGKDATFPGDIAWNFGKFLVTADGRVLRRFEPRTAPDDPEVVKAIEAFLDAK
ncbi:MAG: glutathione peroxidase [Verrucomicrobiae bacterium]|nr:glutathione peroxidase [Verrucomicrobiae bacterium]